MVMLNMNNSTRTIRLQNQFLSLLMLFWLAIPNAAADDAKTILVLGDSISSAYGLAIEDGWVALLQDNLDKHEFNTKIVNASVTGDTTGNGLGRLPDLLSQYKPHMLIIELGGNDGLRGLSIKKLQSNLVGMAEMANDNGVQPVIVAVELPGNYGRAYNKLFNRAFITAATESDAALVSSLFDGMSALEGWFQSDGIHPSAKAQPVMLANVWKVIEPLLEETMAQ